MKLAPLTRQTRLFARRVVNLGSGVRLLPGQELITTHNNRMALPWRRVAQLYEQRRVISEADPYFEEVMQGPGMENNPDFAKAWLRGDQPAQTEEPSEEPEEAAEETAEVDDQEPGTEPGEEDEPDGEPKSEATVVAAGGGWYDVVADGERLNENRLRKDDAEGMAELYNG